MDYRELLEKYNALLEQADRLIKENIQLRAQLGLPESELIQKTISVKSTERKIPDDESAARKFFSDVDNQSDTFSKIRLFISLFKGRQDGCWEEAFLIKANFFFLVQPLICLSLLAAYVPETGPSV